MFQAAGNGLCLPDDLFPSSGSRNCEGEENRVGVGSEQCLDHREPSSYGAGSELVSNAVGTGSGGSVRSGRCGSRVHLYPSSASVMRAAAVIVLGSEIVTADLQFCRGEKV